MAYTNSALAKIKMISPNKNSPRNHVIDTITIHHTAGCVTAKQIGQIFAPVARQASCNYGIGVNGDIVLVCDEKDRSWCSSSPVNDHRAITIEVSNDANGVANKTWTVSNKSMRALIALCADICRRNGIKKLVWSNNKNDRVKHLHGCNMTLHKDFAATACPGPYLESKMPYIADEVNKILKGGSKPAAKTLYKVQIGTFSKKENAEKYRKKAVAAGFKDAFIVEVKK